tara:strand:+ start:1048 stop:3228 length:2181 start_codon:yes stop_codon:yes gene_type:complete
VQFEWLSASFDDVRNDSGQSDSSWALKRAAMRSFCRNLLFVGSFAILGAAIGNVEPMSQGGGLTKVKALLNGIKVPRAVRAQTLLCKIFGTICTVVSGLPAGKLSPLIHCGAIIGGGLSQGKTIKCGTARKCKISIVGRRDFRNDVEKRGFVTMGTAAGVAAAFGAPIGGVLLCLEEGASWWSPRLNWRMTFCAMTSSFCTSLLLSCVSPTGHVDFDHVSEVDRSGVFSFGQFAHDDYSWAELPLFMLIGVIGGTVGAMFNTVYVRLYTYRRESNRNRSFVVRTLEIVAIAIGTSFLLYTIPILFPACHSGTNAKNYSFGERVQRFTCTNPTEFSETASMFLLPPTSSVTWIMHTDGDFDPRSLFAFFVVNAALTCTALSGIGMSGGRFVPLLASGCALGRFFGQVLAAPLIRSMLSRDRTIGLYALLGGAALVGGVERMVLSLTVILMEATDNVHLGLPLLVTLICARWSGHFFFHDSLNDTLIDMNPSLPFVPWNAPRWFDRLGVRHIMTSDPITVSVFEQAGVLFDILRMTKHNCFPVVTYERERDDAKSSKRRLVGCIMRRHLVVLLSEKFKSRCLRRRRRTSPTCRGDEFNRRDVEKILSQRELITASSSSSDGQDESNVSDVIAFEEFEELYPKFVKVKDIDLTEDEKTLGVDLTPYMSIPHTVPHYASLTRGFNTFKRLELRHLCVVGMSGDVVGIITRHDLSLDLCKTRAVQKFSRES